MSDDGGGVALDPRTPAKVAAEVSAMLATSSRQSVPPVQPELTKDLRDSGLRMILKPGSLNDPMSTTSWLEAAKAEALPDELVKPAVEALGSSAARVAPAPSPAKDSLVTSPEAVAALTPARVEQELRAMAARLGWDEQMLQTAIRQEAGGGDGGGENQPGDARRQLAAVSHLLVWLPVGSVSDRSEERRV